MVLTGMHGIIFLMIMPIAVSINGVRTDWPEFLISSRIFVLALLFGTEKMQHLKKDYLVLEIIRGITEKT